MDTNTNHASSNNLLSKCSEQMKTLSHTEQQQLLSDLVLALYGENLTNELPIFAKDKTLIGYLVPSQRVIQHKLDKDPQRAEELDVQSRAPASRLLSDVLQQLPSESLLSRLKSINRKNLR